MRWFIAAYLGALAVLIAGGVMGGVLLFRSSGPDGPAEAAAGAHAYDFLTWEVQHFPRKWIYKVRHLFDNRSRNDEEQPLNRYFNLVTRISALQDQPGDTAELQKAEGERAALKPQVEDIMEGRMTSVLEDQHLAMEPPLFNDLGLIFPPLDFDLDAPPRLLVISPRDHIERQHSYPLEAGLERADFEEIERRAESENGPQTGVSAVVVGTGGVATYPAVVSSSDVYEQVVETAFHEWTHQYLAFFPLGRGYFSGPDLRTLNETTANLAGAALAEVYFKRHPHLQPPATPSPSPAPSSSPELTPGAAFDFTAAMRDLRRQVEEMLARGQITEAEALMEQTREELAEKGYVIRKLNQAYFAFHGSYANTPGSIDPIGPKMEALLKGAGSPGAFVKLAAGITSRADLDRVLTAQG